MGLWQLAKMTQQHYLLKYISIYHCFGNMQGSTTFQVLKFREFEFSMVLEFHGKKFQLTKLEFHKLKFQKGGRSSTYFQNSGRLIYISVNSNIWPFWPQQLVKYKKQEWSLVQFRFSFFFFKHLYFIVGKKIFWVSNG